jgi:hypothetical protein
MTYYSKPRGLRSFRWHPRKEAAPTTTAAITIPHFMTRFAHYEQCNAYGIYIKQELHVREAAFNRNSQVLQKWFRESCPLAQWAAASQALCELVYHLADTPQYAPIVTAVFVVFLQQAQCATPDTIAIQRAMETFQEFANS